VYLTIIIPQKHFGYEMVDLANEVHSGELGLIISYPTSASGITVLLKMPPKYRELK